MTMRIFSILMALPFAALLLSSCTNDSTSDNTDEDTVVPTPTHPAITSWLQNTTITGQYYIEGNSSLIDSGIPANCQLVEYSDDYVYVHTQGLPTYPFGPFWFIDDFDEQDVIYQFPLNPTPNTGTQTQTTSGTIGVLINGAMYFDFRDDVAWDNVNNSLCGGPLNIDCPGGRGTTQDWNRDAVLAERIQFDCSKGHGGTGTFHHHQNPTAYKLDIEVISDICSTYDSDGLYQINESEHSPLIGFAYDGYPIYGAYAYTNLDGTGGISRMKSGYHLRDITTRENGPDVGHVVTYTAGPPENPDTFNDTLNLGYFREDYEFIASSDPDVLDEHNGRFCVTPEYPDGTYAYFCTVDENWNSIYPYAIGPTYYGEIDAQEVTSVFEDTNVYDPSLISLNDEDQGSKSFDLISNPFAELVAIQINDLVKEDIKVELSSLDGHNIIEKVILAGSTIAYFDTQTLYSGTYLIKVHNDSFSETRKILITKS